MTLHFEMVVSAGKVADLQRVGMFSCLGELSISIYIHIYYDAYMDLEKAYDRVDREAM